ncbi:putative ankyrin repeat protein RF_0381 [Macrosteles quadrilineatus]|uniref:putative ankyrin repeat protein RF_0381 n=1 Tax=Macrosteles quadrilineatus TaxID=74068 RepID=UPI0023E0F9F0|nr:putative ankyrin repeat protein RF_0381 [Macrosteles quadrilineatus]
MVDAVQVLFRAIREGQTDIVHFCLRNNDDLLSAVDSEGSTPLHLACSLNNAEVLDLLLSKATPWQTPLHTAPENNDPRPFSSAKSSVVNIQDSNGNSPLHIASINNCSKAIEELIRKGAIVDLPNSQGKTALHLAVQEGCSSVIDELLRLGANVNAKNAEGKSPLHLAVLKKVLSIVAKLVQSGADLGAQDNRGNTPMHYSVVCGSLQVFKYLHHAGSVASTNHRQQTLMHFVLENLECKNCFDTINWLLFIGVDATAQDDRGETVLHYVAREGSVAYLRSMKNNGVDFEKLVKVQSKDGRTALHLAAKYNWLVFDWILKDVSDLDIKDSKGVTPFEVLTAEHDRRFGNDSMPLVHYCIHYRLCQVLKLVLSRNPDIERKFKGDTPLIVAAKTENLNAVDLLISEGADLNAQNNKGQTALHVAVLKSSRLVLKLACKGADVNIKSHQGKTPLDTVLRQNSVDIDTLACLLNFGALIDVFGSNGGTSLSNILPHIKKNQEIMDLINQHLIKLKAAGMLNTLVDIQYEGFEEFHKRCLEEIDLMKSERYKGNSLYDVFSKFRNPLYICNDQLETEINSFKECGEYKNLPIYGPLLYQTYLVAKERFTLLRDAQCFFRLLKFSNDMKLPDELERIVLTYLGNDDLKALIKACQPSSKTRKRRLDRPSRQCRQRKIRRTR